MKNYPDRGLHGRLVNELGTAIVSGELVPGYTLDPDKLASERGVSRTVVREAIRVLSGKGLVDARPKRGTFVLARSNWNLLDPDVLAWQFQLVEDPEVLERLHEVRLMVEPSASALAAERRTADDLVELREAFSHMSSGDLNPDQIAAEDIRFHVGLLRATHNELIQQLSTLVGIGLSARDRFVHTHDVPLEDAIGLHRAVLAAVEAGDAAAAERAMRNLVNAAGLDTRRIA